MFGRGKDSGGVVTAPAQSLVVAAGGASPSPHSSSALTTSALTSGTSLVDATTDSSTRAERRRRTPSRLKRSLVYLWLLLVPCIAGAALCWVKQHELVGRLAGSFAASTKQKTDQLHEQFSQATADYHLWHPWLFYGAIGVSAVLVVLLARHYVFMVRCGNRTILNSSLLTVLICALVCGYAILGQYRADAQIIALDFAKAESELRYLPRGTLLFLLAGLIETRSLGRSLRKYR